MIELAFAAAFVVKMLLAKTASPQRWIKTGVLAREVRKKQFCVLHSAAIVHELFVGYRRICSMFSGHKLTDVPGPEPPQHPPAKQSQMLNGSKWTINYVTLINIH